MDVSGRSRSPSASISSCSRPTRIGPWPGSSFTRISGSTTTASSWRWCGPTARSRRNITPNFPQQIDNISYGIATEMQTIDLHCKAVADAKVLVPTNGDLGDELDRARRSTTPPGKTRSPASGTRRRGRSGRSPVSCCGWCKTARRPARRRTRPRLSTVRGRLLSTRPTRAARESWHGGWRRCCKSGVAERSARQQHVGFCRQGDRDRHDSRRATGRSASAATRGAICASDR